MRRTIADYFENLIFPTIEMLCVFFNINNNSHGKIKIFRKEEKFQISVQKYVLIPKIHEKIIKIDNKIVRMGEKKFQKIFSMTPRNSISKKYIRHFHTWKKEKYTSGYARENEIFIFLLTFDDFSHQFIKLFRTINANGFFSINISLTLY